MKIFVTGASGFIGSAIVAELLRAGHEVLGLARSDASATAIAAAGAGVHRGDLADIASLRTGAKTCDGVIHTGFVHDFARFKEVCELDRQVIEAFGEELAGTQKPLLVSSGVAIGGSAKVLESDRVVVTPESVPRVATEIAADAVAARGVRVGLIRFAPTVHGKGDHGFVPMLIDLARRKGVSAYVGDGKNLWPAVHRLDAATLARHAIEHAFAPGQRFHAVAEEGVPFKQIAEIIGKHLKLPVASKAPGADAAGHFEWFAHFAAMDRPASSAVTRELVGWKPTHPDLIADLESAYFV
jgi:nucleoside-diphosphate-sugar epimerase